MQYYMEKNYFLKRPLFVLGVILISSVYGSNLSPFFWKALFVIGLCSLGPQIVMFFRDEAKFNKYKDCPAFAYLRLFMTAIVLADVNTVDEYGDTPLMLAAEHREDDVVKALIEAGADVNAKDKNGKTALDYARENGYDEIVGLLEGKTM